MGELRALSVSQQVGLLFVVLFGLLALVTIVAFGRSLRDLSPAQTAQRERFAIELRALWLGALLFWVSWASGPLGSTLLFGFVSFFALREFVTLTHTRRADHRALLLAFFVILPMQYVLVGTSLLNAFTVFIPVYVFFAIPVISALAMGAIAGAAGTLGEFVMMALKRDAGVRNFRGGSSVTGAVGLLDRVAPLCFAAPVFFHSVRGYFGI